MGSQNATGGFSSLDVAICTIEKANGLINRLLEEGKMDMLGMIVVDELHMVGDANRGYLLELLLTKVRFVEAKTKHAQNIGRNPQKCAVQIIGMSATLPNLDLLSRWLNAELYHTEFRPVSLVEMMKIGNALYNVNGMKIRDLDPLTMYKGDEDGVITMCLEVIRTGHSVLIFCPTKSWCEKLCDSIARVFYGLRHGKAEQQTDGFVKASTLLAPKLNEAALKDVIEQLKRTPVGLDNVLARVVPQGVAYHHAGLTFDERDVIEGAFRQLAIRVLVATSTLSSGVNLPARRVIIRTPIFNRNVIDTLTYKQMVGRAGRKGIDTYGESILICKLTERIKAEKLMKSDLTPVRSCLVKSESDSLSSSMKRAILEVIVSGVASTPQQVENYAKCTLLAASMEMVWAIDINNEDPISRRTGVIEKCIDFLTDSELISLRKCLNDDGVMAEQYTATNLGSAVLASSLAPDEGLAVFTELQKARRCFVLENDLHIIYLVTPIYMADQWGTLDWYKYLCYWEQLSSGMKRVAELVGVSESFLSRAVQGRIPTKTAQQMRTLRIHKRFYTALVLHDLVNERPLPEVANKYGCARGMLQSLQQGAATFAGMVTVFCNRLGWTSLELLLDQFQSRLTFGVQRELVDLVRITILNAQRARALYNGGFQTVAAVSNADPVLVEKLLKTALPFQSKKPGDGETDWDAAERQKSRCIWVAGQKALTECEAAILIIEEAKQLLKVDLEQMGVQWIRQETTGSNQPSSTNRSGTQRASSKEKHRGCKNSNVSTGSHDSVLSPPPTLNLSKTGKLETSVASQDSQKSTEGNVFVKPVKPRFGRRASTGVTLSENTVLSGSQHCVSGKSQAVTDSKNNACRNDMMQVRRLLGEQEEMASRLVDKSDAGFRCSDSVKKSSHQCATYAVSKHLEHDVSSLDDSKCSEHKVADISELTDSKLIRLVSAASKSNITWPSTHNGSDINAVVADVCQSQSNVSAELYSEPLEPIQGEPAVEKMTEKEVDPKMGLLNRKVDYNRGNVSDELYTEPLCQNIQSNSCNMTNDSLFLDTQVLHLIANFSSSPHHGSSYNEAIGESDRLTVVSEGCDIDLHRDDVANSAAMINNSPDNGTVDGTPLIYSDPEQYSMMDEYMNEYCTQVTACCNLDVHPSTSRKNCDQLYVSIHKEDNYPKMCGLYQDHQNGNVKKGSLLDLSPANNVADVSGLKDEDILCESYLNKVTDGQQTEELLPASCYDRLVPPTYDNECLVDDEQTKPLSQSTRSQQFMGTAGNYTNLREDLEIAENMDEDSFFCLMPKCTVHDKENLETNVSQCLKRDSPDLLCVKNKLSVQNNPGFTSLTLSMLQKELDSEIDLYIPEKSCSSCGDQNCGDHSVQFSPETTALLDVICQNATPEMLSKKPLRRSTRRLSKQKISSPNTLAVTSSITPSIASIEKANKRNTRMKNINPPPKVRKSSKPLNESHNESGGSDCVPPTPPPTEGACDGSKVSTPKRLLGGVVSTPQRKRKSVKDKEQSTSRHRTDCQHSSVDKTPNVSVHKSRQSRRVDTGKCPITAVQSDNGQQDPGESLPFSFSLPMTNESFTIIDVASSKMLFEHFIEEWTTKSVYALAIACERIQPASDDPIIGGNFKKASKKQYVTPDGLCVEGTDLIITGLAVSWNNRDAYFLALTKNSNICDPNDSLSPPPIAQDLPVSLRLSMVKPVLESITSCQGEDHVCLAFDIKEQLKMLSRGCGMWIHGECYDPKVAVWLLDPGDSEKNLHRLVNNYIPEDGHLLEDLGGGIGLGSVALNPDNPGSGRVRSCVEVVLVRNLMIVLETRLCDASLWSAYKETEMPSLLSLTRMELNGFGFSKDQCEIQKKVLQTKMANLEEEAYKLAGHPFSLTSTDDVSQVLFIELHLPPSGDISAPAIKKRLGPRRKVRGSQFSTSKDILDKLKVIHPLPGVILEWRRLNAVLTKVVFPYQRECVYNKRLSMNRVHGVTQFHTATGRVSMSEPNIQNIPRNFDIDVDGLVFTFS
ncbi:hypothetical protein LSH36_9g16021 [Paralvinella palmiformis]|uniref:DNA polymerase theta n=1 Tax=Paralvinella palmiformis TaxID=53620 RepID=A0AAD9KE83_9ANNE|nr:hypothetical protein LSH36_9g16021 [Paralvinella palmiformis]